MEIQEKIHVSNNWRNAFNVKHLLQEETTPEIIVTLCNTIVEALKVILAKEQKGNLKEDYRSHVENELDELIGHFEFLKNLADGAIEGNESEGRIPESEWHNYCFDGDFEQWFNDYFSQLYDLGDERVVNIHNVQEKFIWIG